MPLTPSQNCPPEPAETASARLVTRRSAPRHSARRTRRSLDHGLLLETPFVAAPDPTTSAPPLLGQHRRVHSDLLPFHPQPSGSAAGERTSSDV